MYGVASRFAERAIRSSGIRLIERYAKAFNKYDKKIHRNLYGQSGGRGVRHGRDAGSALAGLWQSYQGDALDEGKGSGASPGKLGKARNRYGNKRRSSSNQHRSNRCSCRFSNTRRNYRS